MPGNVVIHVIPNTHWDREWLYSFQETRFMLTQFMRKLLDVLETEPEYKSYLLDSQTVPLEDHLEIYPEDRPRLERLVKEGRLWIGPWYTLPEEFLVSGESLVRNLLRGHRVAQSFGRVMKIGYSPFSYGQCSQMPQIYAGFGINSILFYHGIRPDEAPSEFIFEGADGTQLFASRMGSFARYNFFFKVFRPATWGKETLERHYDWCQGGVPFHLNTEDLAATHFFLVAPEEHLNRGRLLELLQRFVEEEKQHATTRHLAAMDGMDSTQPSLSTLEIVREAQKLLPDAEVRFSSLPEWIEAARRESRNLVVLKGERRTPRRLGSRAHLYGDVTSARPSLKRANARAEIALQRLAEPFGTLAWLAGANDSRRFLDLAWKYLLRAHPHDSIAGSGVDQIEHDMHYRLDQVVSLSSTVLRNALQDLQSHTDGSSLPRDAVLLVAYNPSPRPRSDVVDLVVDLPEDLGLEHFDVVDLQGQPLQIWEVARHEARPVVRHLGDATMEMPGIRVHLQAHFKDLPALGYQTFLLRPRELPERLEGTLVPQPRTLENAFLRVTIRENGSFDLLDKRSGHLFANQHVFEDSGEAGHAWRHIPPAYDRVVTSEGCRAEIELLQDTPLVASYRVHLSLDVPVSLREGRGNEIRRLDAEGDDARRSEETVPLDITSTLTLRAGRPFLEVETRVVNRARDHRLRVLFPTGLERATHSYAETPFDVVARPIDRGPDSPWRGTWNPTHPFQRFVDVSDGEVGLAFLGEGLREYEVADRPGRTLAVTLLRAFEVALTTVSWRWERHPEMHLSQAPGEHVIRYAVYPHAGSWTEANVPEIAERFLVPIRTAQTGVGRGTLPLSFSALKVQPETLQLSAFKPAEDGRTTAVVRLYNPTDKSVNGSLRFGWPLRHAWLLNLNEERQEPLSVREGSTVFLTVGPKKIVTVELERL